jgi:hypothetical protein
MDVVNERILIFGDSLSHHGSDGAPEIWNVDADSNRASSAPGDLLGSLLLEQGAQAVRINANVGRSAHNFWAGNARYQFHSADALIADDRAWQPTKVIVMLGTNDADSGAIDAAAMTAIRDTYAGMGAEVWAVGPPIFTSNALNIKADQAFTMMASVFGKRLIDARPLSSKDDRANDGVHFRPGSTQTLAIGLQNALLTTKAPKPWLGLMLGIGALSLLGFVMWRRFSPTGLQGEKVPAYFVNPDDGEVIEVDQQTAVFRPKRNDRLPGGKAAGRPDSDFDPKALARGLKVELEHTRDREIAKEIAKDHLAEDPAYYTKLKSIHLDGLAFR